MQEGQQQLLNPVVLLWPFDKMATTGPLGFDSCRPLRPVVAVEPEVASPVLFKCLYLLRALFQCLYLLPALFQCLHLLQ